MIIFYFSFLYIYFLSVYILKQLHKKIVCAWLAKEITMMHVEETKLGHLVLQLKGALKQSPLGSMLFWTCNERSYGRQVRYYFPFFHDIRFAFTFFFLLFFYVFSYKCASMCTFPLSHYLWPFVCALQKGKRRVKVHSRS